MASRGEHYRKAEELLAETDRQRPWGEGVREMLVAKAQAHAMLAIVTNKVYNEVLDIEDEREAEER